MSVVTEERESDVVRRDRFSGGPARSFLSSMDADERLFDADLAVDRAHVVMLAEQAIIEDSTASAILDALESIEDAGFEALPDGEDIHAAIETAVIDRVGADGGRMHTARSRNDEVATCLRYRFRGDLLDAVEVTLDLRSALLGVAANHLDTVMPGYTHLQPAQPTTVAHWLCSYESAFARDAERLLDAYDRTNRSPLGAAAFAGTPFPIDRERTAELLGFGGVIENAADAAASRDALLESAGAASILATTLSGLAEDAIIFANRGFLELDDDYASTSSIMPQKKNPDTLELVRASAGDAAGAVTGLQTTLKGLPRAYNRDLQQATPHVWRAIDAVTDATTVATGAVTTATWDAAVLETAAAEGFSTATGVADRLAMAGVPFRSAHEVVATAAEASGGDTPSLADIDEATRGVLGEPLDALVDPDSIERALDPTESVAMRNSRGGPAPATVDAAIADAEAALRTDSDTITDHQDSLDDAHAALDQAVSTYV